PAPRQVVDDHPREDDPEAPADAEHGRDEADRDADLFARELVPDDREAERKDASGDALHGAKGDQRPDVPRRRGADAADEEDGERDRKQALLCVLAPAPAADRR